MKYAIVPLEPTPEMCHTAEAELDDDSNWPTIWAAMLEVAPSPWIPLDPAKPGYRLPNLDDGEYLITWNPNVMPGSSPIGIRHRVYLPESGAKYWMPATMIPGPEKYQEKPE